MALTCAYMYNCAHTFIAKCVKQVQKSLYSINDVGMHYVKNSGNNKSSLSRILAQSCITLPYVFRQMIVLVSLTVLLSRPLNIMHVCSFKLRKHANHVKYNSTDVIMTIPTFSAEGYTRLAYYYFAWHIPTWPFTLPYVKFITSKL